MASIRLEKAWRSIVEDGRHTSFETSRQQHDRKIKTYKVTKDNRSLQNGTKYEVKSVIESIRNKNKKLNLILNSVMEKNIRKGINSIDMTRQSWFPGIGRHIHDQLPIVLVWPED